MQKLTARKDNPNEVNLSEAAFIKKERLAKELFVTPRTIEHWMKRGFIPFIKIGTAKQARVLFELDQVKAALSKRCGNASAFNC